MRSALRTRAGPNARYADCGSAAGATLNARLLARARNEEQVDRAVRVGRARAAIAAALPSDRAAARAGRAVVVGAARRPGGAEVLAGRAHVRSAVARGLARGATAVRAAVAGRAHVPLADPALALGVAGAVLAELAALRGD